MSVKNLFSITLLALLTAVSARGANFEVVATNNLVFQPANLTIQVGDTVTWTNGGGFHNVEANDGSFRCANGCDGDGAGGNGAPANNAWSFTLTFDTPGSFDYFCAVHVGVGMTGTIVVEGGAQAGALRFSTGTYQVGEGDGSATVTVNRTGGDDGAVSVDFATSNGSATAGQDYSATSGTLDWADGDDASKTFSVAILDDSVDESQEVLNLSLSNPSGGATLGSPNTATLRIADNDDAPPPPPGDPGSLSFAQASQSVAETAGSVEVVVNRTDGSDGDISVSYASADGSATADADYTPASGTLNWGDGDATEKSFMVQILDDADPEGDETIQLSLANPTGGATLGATSASTLTIETSDMDFGPCQEDAQTLCLGENDRFRVQVTFRTQNDEQGSGQAVDFGRRDSGLFFFFNENNIEMLVKVLDACNVPAFQTYWVFFAATTNVEFDLTVVDTEADQIRRYVNPLGMAALPIQDTEAFDTCP